MDGSDPFLITGISSMHDKDSAPLMILEYMPHGDLENFLQSHRLLETFADYYYLFSYCNAPRATEEQESSIKEPQLHSFATDVSYRTPEGQHPCVYEHDHVVYFLFVRLQEHWSS